MPRSLIDSHIHFSSHERLGELERYLRSIGAERMCMLSLPVKQRVNFNPEVLFAKAHLGPACYGLASFDYSPLFRRRSGYGGDAGGRADLDLSGQVERFGELGFDGLKIFLGKPSFQSELGLKLDDPEVLAALKRAESLKMPVLIHIADPLVFWSYRSIPGFIPPGWEQAAKSGGEPGAIPGYEELQRQALEVLRACPELTVVFPHLLSMGQDLSRLAQILDAYPRAYLDLAPGLYFYCELDRQREEARAFFSLFAKRILFGTDAFWFPRWFTEFPYATVEDNLARGRYLLRFLETEQNIDNPFVPTQRVQKRVRGLGLSDDVVQTLCVGSFEDVYPPAPRSLEPRACLEYLDGFLGRLRLVQGDGEIVAAVERLRRSLNDLFRESSR
jgi:hypothetical protein